MGGATHVARAASWTFKKKLAVYGGSLLTGGSAVGVYRAVESPEDLYQIGAIRFGRAVKHVGAIVCDYRMSLRGLDDLSPEYAKKMKEVHQRSAERLLELCCANGGVFIKVGQHCAALEYLLPPEYTETLSVLLDRAPQSSFEDVKFVVERELKQKMEDVFVKFSEKPVGAASLAQVHVAYRKDTGEKVACKVQHKRLQKNYRTDVNTMEFLVNVASILCPEFKLMWLVAEVKKNMPYELDFLNEGKNADRARELYKHLKFLKIPTIHYDLSTNQMLTMEFCEGQPINNREYLDKNKIDKHDICTKLGRLIAQMIFIDGCLHADPHPGNILINKKKNGKTEIVLLDHGLYCQMDDAFRQQYSNFWMALLKPDQNAIKQCAREMGVGELYGLLACIVTQRSWKSVTSGIRNSQKDESEKQEMRLYAVSLIPQISEFERFGDAAMSQEKRTRIYKTAVQPSVLRKNNANKENEKVKTAYNKPATAALTTSTGTVHSTGQHVQRDGKGGVQLNTPRASASGPNMSVGVHHPSANQVSSSKRNGVSALGPLKATTSHAERVLRALRGKTVPPTFYEVQSVEIDVEKDEKLGLNMRSEVICGVLQGTVCQGKLHVGDIMISANGMHITDVGFDNKNILTNIAKVSRKKCKFDYIRFKSRAPVQMARMNGYSMSAGYDYSTVVLYLIKGINIGLDLRSIDEKVFVEHVEEFGSAYMGLGVGDSILECEGKFVTTAEQLSQIILTSLGERGVALMTVETPIADNTKNTVRYKLQAAQNHTVLDLPLDLDALEIAKKAVVDWHRHKTINPKPIFREKRKLGDKSPHRKNLKINEKTKLHGIPMETNLKLLVKVPPPKAVDPQTQPPQEVDKSGAGHPQS